MALYTADVKVAAEFADIALEMHDEIAIQKAAVKNALLLQRTIKEVAEENVGAHIPYGRDRGPGNSMIDNYYAEANSQGGVIAWNNTARADYFEFGTEEHEIWASGLFARGRAIPPRGSQGRFTRGSRALSFSWAGGWFLGPMVNHPGQPAIPVMAMALERAEEEMASNLLDELQEAWAV